MNKEEAEEEEEEKHSPSKQIKEINDILPKIEILRGKDSVNE
jgi:hypothetical protein